MSDTQRPPANRPPSLRPPGGAGDVVLAPRHAVDRAPRATHIRGTVLASSLAAIDGLGLRDDYFATLTPEHHDAMRALVVNDWIPMPLALAHYGALDAMGLSGDIARENGRKVADRVQRSYLATLVRALGVGITPWSLLPRVQSVLDRLLLGSTVAIYKVGPKDARIEMHGIPIAQYAYVRSGWAGMIEGGMDLVCRKSFVKDVSRPRTETVAMYLVTWA